MAKQCVVCGKKALAAPVTVTVGPETRIVELCQGHAQPILDLFGVGHTTPSGGIYGESSRKPAHQVIPIEDWKP